MGCAESHNFPSDTTSNDSVQQIKRPRESKVVVLGDSGAGKSSLVLRFCQGRFPQSHEVTIGAAFMQQTVRSCDGSPHKLHIWDTGGQERFRAMAPLYYRDAAGALVVFDCSDVSSFTSVSYWIDELHSKGPVNIIIFVVGNKCDTAPTNKRVDSKEAELFCKARGLNYFETSALSGEGVIELFQALGEQISEVKREK